MLKEVKYFIYILIISFFTFFTIKFYISDENKKKTFRNMNSIDKNISTYETKLPIILNDTNDIIIYLNNDDDSKKKEFSFWNLLKSND